MKLKNTAKKVGLLLGSFVIVFVVLEIGFRVYEGIRDAGRGTKEGWAIYDADLKYRPRPGFEDFNPDGLRDDPIDAVKTRFRVLMLGDSIPFYGDDVHDTYIGHLETYLSRDREADSPEVINAGVRGYTNYQEVEYLKKFGLKFAPDLVGFSFCLNDLHKYLHEFEVEDGKIVGEKYTFTTDAVKSVDSVVFQIARKSRLLVWLRHRLSVFDDIVELQATDGYTFDYRPDFSNAWKDEPWQAIEAQLAEVVELGKKHDFGVFLVVFPFGEQLRKDYLERDREYVTKPQRLLGEICGRLGIPFLDLFSVIDREKHLVDDQIHLTKEGRKFVAQKVATFLKKNNLIPAVTPAEGER